MKNDQVKELSIQELCNGDKYIIPIYQRNYAWGRDEIELLINDISEMLNKNKDYYIGSLVVSKREDGYEVIDGQQRLTTLKLLLSYYNKEESINLDFEYRDESNHSFKNIHLNKNNKRNSIEQGFEIINILKPSSKLFNFLLKNVIILRIEVPENTDLNHYFEIMNNRGEQLEKHEILKARLMNILQEEKRSLFALIWDACSDMSKYAIKHFPYSHDESKSIRTHNEFFGSSCNKIPSNFNRMQKAFKQLSKSNSYNKNDILSLLTNHKIEEKNNDKEYNEIRDETFNSIIDFPNFLMISLRIFYKEKQNDEKISLNDKNLLKSFNNLNEEDNIIDFTIVMLKCRLIFDRYIIKSRSEDDSWTLNKLKKYKNGKFKEIGTFSKAFEYENEIDNEDTNYSPTKQHIQIVQLLAMFHTSFRQKIYKEWLYDILYKLYKHHSLKEEYHLKPNTYIKQLEKIANKYYLDPERQKMLKQEGTAIPNYIFNYLDYLLWKGWEKIGKDNKLLKKDSIIFSLARNSIEHYLPKSKIDQLLDDVSNKEDREKILNNFGNLCLISNYQNSTLNDATPSEKKERYESGNLKCISPKQALMLGYKKWGKKQIKAHNKEMRKILEDECKKFNFSS